MAISHLCLSCGLDLARTRAVIDHELSLPVVTCPECGWSCVRRRHPLIITWRRSNKLRTTAAVLFMQLLVSITLVWTLAYLCRRLTDQMTHDHISLLSAITGAYAMGESAMATMFQQGVLPDDPVGPFGATVWLGLSALAGVWLGACFPHWKRWTLVLLWTLVFSLFNAVDAVAWLLNNPLMVLFAHPTTYVGPLWPYWRTLAPVIAASVGISIVALPLGAPMRIAYRAVVRRQSRKLRQRLRRTRIES